MRKILFNLIIPNVMKNYSPVTLGKSLTKLEKNGLVLTESKHEPNISLSRHVHENASIACTLEGSYTENSDKKYYECTPQSILIKPRGEYHSNKYNRAGAHCLIIEVKPERQSDYNSLYRVFTRTRLIKKGDYFSIINRLRRELRISDSSSEIAIEGLTLELLAKINRHTKKLLETGNPYWLKEVRDFIHAHFNEPISLSDVAEAVGYHSSHIARVFRQHNNCSIGKYIRQLRIENATEQLIKTNRSLAEISAAAGFYDQSHFTSSFKLYMGTTPSKYRANKC